MVGLAEMKQCVLVDEDFSINFQTTPEGSLLFNFVSTTLLFCFLIVPRLFQQ